MARQIKKHGKFALILGLILTLVAIYGLIPLAKADTCPQRSDTLSDSRPSTVSDHTVKFKTPTGVDASTDTITLTFAAGFDLSTNSVAFGDMDLEIDAACDGTYEIEKTLAAAPGTSPTWGAEVSAQVITFTAPTDASSGEIAADSCVMIEIGTNADSGSNQIINPTAGVKDIDIAGDFGDTGKIKVSIISGVTVSATVAETLSFQINTVLIASCTGDTGSPTVLDTTASDAVDFGTLNADTFYVACHELQVSTNAGDGYSLTTQETINLKYESSYIIDTTCDGGACSETAQDDWITASANQGLGHTCTNVAGKGTDCNTVYTAASGDCGATPCYRQFACVGANADCDPGSGEETPEEFMANAEAVDDNRTQVHYKVSIGGGQAAGVYQNAIVYVATPTY